MTRGSLRALAAATLIATASGQLGCGYFLHPERRGRQSGTIDSATMVMDLLWLIPGVIPGVIALVVDFSSGAIYAGGRTALRVPADGRVAIRLPRTAAPARLEFRLVTASRRVLAQRTAVVGPSTRDGQAIELTAAGASPREPVYIEVRSDSDSETGGGARFPTVLEVRAE